METTQVKIRSRSVAEQAVEEARRLLRKVEVYCLNSGATLTEDRLFARVEHADSRLRILADTLEQ